MTEKRTWTLKIDEDELKALIAHHSNNHQYETSSVTGPKTERSARIHDLTKRLNNNISDAKPNAATEAALKEAETSVTSETKAGW